MPPPKTNNRRIWLTAFLLTVALHVGAVMGIVALKPITPTPVEAKNSDPIQLVFAEKPAVESEDPGFFSELPEDRADEPPEQADFLSNVDSRARDQIQSDTETHLPGLDGQSDAPHVQMDPGTTAPPTPDPGTDEETTPDQEEVTSQADPGEETGDDDPLSATAPGGDQPPLDPATSLENGDPEPQRGVAEPDPIRPGGSDPLRGLRRPGGTAAPFETDNAQGNLDIYQEEMSNPEGDAGLDGDISLSTTRWDYAPWIKRFRRAFMANWYAPYAFYVGLIHGSTLVQVEIAPDGTMLSLDVLEEQGDASLHAASVAAFRAVAPFEPLPGNFPEESLVLTIKLTYPEHRRRR